MKFIQKIRYQLHDRMIEKKLNPQLLRHSIDYEKVSWVGILFNGTTLESRDQVQAFAKQLKAKGKKVDLFCFIDSKEEQPDFGLAHFTKKDLNWLGKNQAIQAQEFCEKQFDLLIGCEDELPLNDLAAQSKSKLRVGPITEKEYCYDLMVARKPTVTLATYLNQIEQLLNKLKQGKNAKKSI